MAPRILLGLLGLVVVAWIAYKAGQNGRLFWVVTLNGITYDHAPPEGDALEALGATVARYAGAEHGFVHDPSHRVTPPQLPQLRFTSRRRERATVLPT